MPKFFATAAAFGDWLGQHGATEVELIVGFHKRGSGLASMTWPESVDEALCFGWIDGVRKRIDELSYQIRFTPRKPASTWSAVNVERVRVLAGEGHMHEAGLAAYARRIESKSGIYSYEQSQAAELAPQDEARFRRNKAAWRFFQSQPAGYRHLMIWRVLNAKRAETRQARLAKLIEASQAGVRL